MSAIRRGGSLSNTDSVTVRRVTIPLTAQTGDVGLIAMAYYQPTTGAAALTLAGWTLIDESVLGDYRLVAFRRTLTGPDPGSDVEITFATAQRAPMVLEVWGGLSGVPSVNSTTTSPAATTHPLPAGGTGTILPFGLFGHRSGSPPSTMGVPSGWTLGNFGSVPASFSAATGITYGPAETGPTGALNLTTAAAVTSLTMTIGWPVTPEVNNLRLHEAHIRAFVAPVKNLRVHSASVSALITPYMIRRGGKWLRIRSYVRKSGAWK
ncbi:hypothetical protein [Paeniglutamicibacter terrestris]|uniref:Minor tail protein n=1 Tax=Paeniglutamicibacter terrestris TaxID=2723403 RepID=A0ABX1G650_9MICC|nr:hypothetical protein [Paeniglutamicibacter terrestris]NKG21120.1 hypothetical protein [Paeniglutamicibacter terrestris]